MRKTPYILCALALAGCTVGPNYKAPEMHTPGRYGEQATDQASPADDAALAQWWTRIDDAELQSLITRALHDNLDLRTAASRLRQARDQMVIAGAAELPKVGSSAVALGMHSNSNPLSALSGGSSGGSSSSGAGSSGGSGASDLHLYTVGFDATWEADIFGGGRRAIEAARDNAEATRWQMRDGEVSLTAEIANDYMALRTAQARRDVLNAEYQSENGTLGLITARAQAGFLTQLDINQQRVVVANTAAQIPPVDAEIRAGEHAIAVLLAEEPESLEAELDRSAALPSLPTTLPVGLPSDLLRRRPDIRVAERKLAAATAQEGVAIADLYPKFNILGLLSLVNSDAGQLFTSSSLSEIGAGQISWPIFDGGRIHANIRIKQEDKLQAYNAYRQAILKALQDVEDALVRLNTEERRTGDLNITLKSARSSLNLATQQYQTGLVAYVNVLTAQSQYNQAQDQIMQNAQARAQDMIALFKALGGGWGEDERQAER